MNTSLLAATLGLWITATALAQPLPTAPADTNEASGLIVVFQPSRAPAVRQGLATRVVGARAYTLRKVIAEQPRRTSGRKPSARAEQALERLNQMFVIDIADPDERAATLRALMQSPDVLYVEPNLPVYLQAAPTDPMYPRHYGLENNGQPFWITTSASSNGTPGADINWRPAWDAGLPTN
ncbi:MAG TPA: hypothetical protein PKE12_15580, partial [Kiritimatiellia bacterium]|nr:hypothetical protein [Kiritimatiellia bacterium]